MADENAELRALQQQQQQLKAMVAAMQNELPRSSDKAWERGETAPSDTESTTLSTSEAQKELAPTHKQLTEVRAPR